MTDAETTAIYDRLVAAATAGCCMNEGWRGRMCPYHSGYAAGVDVTLQEMEKRTAPDSHQPPPASEPPPSPG